MADRLGEDRKPVYAASGATEVTTGRTEFDQGYRDVAGVNMRVLASLAFSAERPFVFVYDDRAFFPADGQGVGRGAQGRPPSISRASKRSDL